MPGGLHSVLYRPKPNRRSDYSSPWALYAVVFNFALQNRKLCMLNDKYDPPLSKAGFMDLLSVLHTSLDSHDAIKSMPTAQREAAVRLNAAVMRYVETVEGNSASSMPTLNLDRFEKVAFMSPDILGALKDHPSGHTVLCGRKTPARTIPLFVKVGDLPSNWLATPAKLKQ